jgi:beta-hydroxyacyl-ACP dehydratase FabZ
MLLVDRVLEVVPGKTCIGLKNVTINEAYFEGHYPGRPIMPGVLIIEAMAQAGAILILSQPENEGKAPLIGSIDNVKFKRPVVPGDQLISSTELLWFRSNIGKMKASATVDGEVVATMELTFKVIPMD